VIYGSHYSLASFAVAFLPVMGIGRWDIPSRKYGSLHGQQLFYPGILEKLASHLQSMDRPVNKTCSLDYSLIRKSDRYIYVPLGGTKNLMFSSVLIFTFVALWHDLSFRLLAWGWLVSLFFIPEISAGILLRQTKVRALLIIYHCSLNAI
jgi:MBOAT, membrane-bound O-acyltransferase family